MSVQKVNFVLILREMHEQLSGVDNFSDLIHQWPKLAFTGYPSIMSYMSGIILQGMVQGIDEYK